MLEPGLTLETEMDRAGWVLLLLLLGTNAAWFLVWTDESGGSGAGVVDAAALQQTVDELEQEVARLQRAEPVLLGMGEEAADAAARREAAAGAEGGSTEADGEPASAEELAMARAREAEEQAQAEAARKKVREETVAKATAMLRKVMQVEDPALRAEGLAEIRDALQGDDELMIEYTLSCLWSLRDVEIDRSMFQGLVRGFLESENGGIRRSALYAYAAMNPEGKDLRIALQSAGDPAPVVRQHTAKLLTLYGGSKIEGESATAVVGLLEDENPNVVRGTIRGISGAEIAPEVERTLIHMAEDPQMRREAVHGLGSVTHKSRDVVDALLARLSDENHRVRAGAHQGLQRGVAKEQQQYVATRYAERLEKFLNPTSHKEALNLIARYGDRTLTPQLERFAGNEMVDAEVRTMATKVAEYLATRK